MVVFSSLKIDIPKKKMCCKAAKTKKVKEQKQTKNKQKNPEATYLEIRNIRLKLTEIIGICIPV